MGLYLSQETITGHLGCDAICISVGLFASHPVNFKRFTAGRLSYIPEIVKLYATPGCAVGLSARIYIRFDMLYYILYSMSNKKFTFRPPPAGWVAGDGHPG